MLRMASTTIVCLLIMMFAVPSQAKLGNPEIAITDNYALLERIFTESGASLQEIKLHHWGQISNKSETLPELETKYLVLVKRLGLDPGQKTVQIDRDGLISISQLQIMAGGTIQIFIQAVPQQESRGLTHWGISLQTGNLEQAADYYQRIKSAMQELGCREEPRLEAIGIMAGNLAKGERDDLVKRLAYLARAQYVEGAAEGSLISKSYYTLEAKGDVQAGGRLINLNLAVRDVPSQMQTKLYIGIPLIFSDY